MNKTITIAAALILAGCSNVPDASDIRDELEQGWAGCPGVKVIDLKKTNGVDHGNTYQMAVSWKFKILKDMTNDEAMNGGLCSDVMQTTNFIQVAMRDPKFVSMNRSLKKGDTIDISDSYTMVKSEKGWILK